MKVEILSLCDFAQAEPTGKLNILGAFDHIHAKEAPITRSVFAFAARVRFEQHEEGPKIVTLAFIDSDGKPVLPPIRAQFPVKIQPTESTATLNYVMVVPQIKFSRFGDYQIDLSVGEKIEASIPLYIRQHPGPASPGQ